MERWEEWNRRGLIPGLHESKTSFTQRAGQASPGSLDVGVKGELLHQLGMAPDWVACIVSNRGLLPWHGGVTEIDGGDAHIQVRRSGWFVGGANEVLCHELAHAGRVAFQDDRYEEVFAYATSKRWWRRLLGPIIDRPVEVWLFLFSLLLPLGAEVVLSLAGIWPRWEWPLALYAVPLGLFLLGLRRLVKRHRTVRKCCSHLAELTGCAKRAFHWAYRLADTEIEACARYSPVELEAWIEQQAKVSWRWDLLTQLYLSERR